MVDVVACNLVTREGLVLAVVTLDHLSGSSTSELHSACSPFNGIMCNIEWWRPNNTRYCCVCCYLTLLGLKVSSYFNLWVAQYLMLSLYSVTAMFLVLLLVYILTWSFQLRILNFISLRRRACCDIQRVWRVSPYLRCSLFL